MHEKEFLQAISLALKKYIDEINDLDEKNDITHKTHQILKKALVKENELRRKYDVGCRFQVIRTQLEKLAKHFATTYLIATEPNQPITTTTHKVDQPGHDEIIIYVYLFNIHGKNITSWEKSLSPQMLNEYSINRPIYIHLKDIQELLRNKSTPEYHAYLKVIINKSDILATDPIYNQYNHQLIRLKQNTIKKENIISLHHQDQDYILSAKNKLIIA